MSKLYKLIFGVLILVVIVIAGYLILITGASKQTKTTKPTISAESERIKKAIANRVSVTLTENGFTPATVKIKKGMWVIWTNQSGVEGAVNSDNHPTHLLYPILNLGSFPNGSGISAKFEKVGKYTYHNEFNPDQRGTIIVE